VCKRRLPSDCPYATQPPERLAGNADIRDACCRPAGWGWPIFSEEKSEELVPEILKAIEPDVDKIKAAIEVGATTKAARMWAEEPLCRGMPTESEVYRFTWDSSFHGSAVVRIGRQEDAITLRWVYRWYRTPDAEDAPPVVALTLADWARSGGLDSRILLGARPG
jgi:hypothetical protein